MVEMMGWGAGWVEEGSREREWNVPKSNLYRIEAKSCCIPLKKGGGGVTHPFSESFLLPVTFFALLISVSDPAFQYFSTGEGNIYT